MFHCHNLIHEDDDMLLAFTVTHVDDEQDEASGVVPIAKPGDDAVQAPPFDARFPFDTTTTPGESAERGETSGFEPAKRFVYPKSFGRTEAS